MGFGFEQAAERLQVFKARFVGDLAHGKAGSRNSFFGLFDQLIVDIVLRALPGMGPQQAAEVFGGDMQLGGDSVDVR